MKQITTSKIFLGTFEVKDTELLISDPCYQRGIWCSGKVENVLPGTWNAFVVSGETNGWGKRVWELIALKSDNFIPTFKENSGIHVGVDSSMAGIYSDSFFFGGDQDTEQGKTWYEQCYKALRNPSNGGVIPGGCVSSTGFGDGGYECFIDRNGDKKVVGIKIVFISKQEEMEG